MLFVVNISSLFYVMLGWDGLGLVSFFLIVYYQNSSSILSGVFTLLMNRIGDGFFLVSIVLCLLSSSSLFPYFSIFSSDFVFLLFLILAFMTKRAIFPFSSWLPLAMAAPTPISALVHSSTLVTAGLYLMMRFSYVIYSSVFLTKCLLFVRIFTSFFAGLNTLFEADLKKLIALSTLSHLGFIGMSFSCGFLVLAFFHLLTHALFKSLLFMTIGDIMINLNHSQDVRYLSSGVYYTPFSVFIIYVSLLNLLGMPNLSGFFSKDLVLEFFSYSNSSFILSFLVYVNVFFTYFYTYQLFYYSFSSCKVVPFQLFRSQLLLHCFLIMALGVFSIVFGKLFVDCVYSFFYFLVVPSAFKFLPVFINIVVFLYLLVFISFPVFSRSNFYFRRMLYLTPVLMSVSSFVYYKFLFYAVKDFEIGLPNNFIHVRLVNFVNSLLLVFFNLYRFQVFHVLIVMGLLFIVLL
jgi:NADH-ubiquinone oxidoreductase chain 5